ncbi:MAG: YbaK/EbsC family protein [Hyphomicrobiaceae bacterium]
MPRSQSTPRKNALLPAVTEKARSVWHADLEGPIQNPSDFAKALNSNVARVVKTILLVTRALTWQGQRIVDNPHACVLLSSSDRIDLKGVSQLAARGLRLASVTEVRALLGVQPGSVSPFVPRNV